MDALEKRIEEVRRQIFELDMKDHWDSADYDLNNALSKELEGLLSQKKKTSRTK